MNKIPKTVLIEVDSTHAFDLLANLMAKQDKVGGQEMELAKMIRGLVDQLSYESYWTIRESDEYMALYETYESKKVDDLDQARHRAKQALRQRFWGSELTETKT